MMTDMNLMTLSKRSQVASMDVILASIMFLMVAAFILSYLFSGIMGDKSQELDAESRLLLSRLTSSGESGVSSILISSGDSVSSSRLARLVDNMVFGEDFYENLKSELGIRNEFCIHLEDSDGNLVYMHEIIDDDALLSNIFQNQSDSLDDVLVFGLGHESITIGGRPCVNSINTDI